MARKVHASHSPAVTQMEDCTLRTQQQKGTVDSHETTQTALFSQAGEGLQCHLPSVAGMSHLAAARSVPPLHTAGSCLLIHGNCPEERAQNKARVPYSNSRSLHMPPTGAYKGCGPAVRSVLMVVGAEVQSRMPGAAVSLMAWTFSM